MKTNVITSFANSTRVKLLMCLGEGEKNVTQLIGSCGLSQSAVSQHLEKLRRSNLVSTRRVGKEVIYKLTSEKIVEVANNLLNLAKEVDSK